MTYKKKIKTSLHTSETIYEDEVAMNSCDCI